MEKYERVELEVIEFTAQDVITASDDFCSTDGLGDNDTPIG